MSVDSHHTSFPLVPDLAKAPSDSCTVRPLVKTVNIYKLSVQSLPAISRRATTARPTKPILPGRLQIFHKSTFTTNAAEAHPSTTRIPPLTPIMALDIEAAKKAAAQEAVRNHFPENPRFVGIGSGTTIVYVVEAIKELGKDVSRVGFVPTGYQSKQLIIKAGLVPIEFDALPDNAMIDVAFDGADEVDEDLNCIKGGGACLYQEKLVAMRAKQFICVAGML